MKLDVYHVGGRFRFALRRKDASILFAPKQYEANLPICLSKVENWLMDNGSDVYTK